MLLRCLICLLVLFIKASTVYSQIYVDYPEVQKYRKRLALVDEWLQTDPKRCASELKELEKIAKALGVSKEAIEKFDEEMAINYFNSFYDHSFSNGAFNAHHCTFSPLDKVVELYERLVQAEKDKVLYLEKLLDKYGGNT